MPIALAARTVRRINIISQILLICGGLPVNADAKSMQNPLDAVKVVKSSPIVFITRFPQHSSPSEIPKPPNASIVVGVYPV